MAKHPHAELIKQMVDDDTLRATCTKWTGDFEVITVLGNPHEDWKLMPPKPKTITIVANGKTYELPEPMRVAPKQDAEYFYDIYGEVDASRWENLHSEHQELADGYLFATREAAQQWVDAMAEIRGAK